MYQVPKGVVPEFYGTPTIYITEQCARTMKVIVAEVSMEVGWLMVCHEGKDGNFTLSECIIPAQDCHGATTELTVNGLGNAGMEVLEQDTARGIKDPNAEEFRYNHLNAWFHSHDTMGVSPSGQDDQQMVDFCQKYDGDYPFWVRGIVNKAGDIHVSVYYKCSGAWKVITGCPIAIKWAESHNDEEIKGILKERVQRKRVGGNERRIPITRFCSRVPDDLSRGVGRKV